ncbi:MAG: arsenate reductase ArsC [Proteobacteria bacterium]|nr:arsenate reductase ArsC [Pseudomonadota bacterium]MCP4918699.1 arsenate reductase ArsC [Pseudomonadota bacterium]
MRMSHRSVLFLCVANSARSQMAEALTRARFPEWTVQSAGSQPSRVNPYAVRALAEIGLSTEAHTSKHVDTIDPSSVDVVVMLCAEEECPVFLGDAERLDWSMPDPDRKDEEHSDEARLQFFCDARDVIAAKVEGLCG